MIQLKGKTRTILLFAGVLCILFLIWYFSTIVTYIMLSVVLSFLGRPFMQWFTRVRYKTHKLPRSAAALLSLFFLLALFFTFFSFVIPLVFKELEILSNIDFEAVLHSIEEPLSQILRISGNDPLIIEDKSLTDILVEQI